MITNNIMRRIFLATTGMATVLTLTACATAVNEGNMQVVSIDTDPQGAYCTVSRESTQLGGVTTPGVLPVKRDQHPLQVVCNRQGYQEGEGYLISGLDPWIFGNVLTAGVGAVVDIGTGAASVYKEGVTVTLVPEAFDTAAEKRDFQTMMQDRIDSKAQMLQEQIERGCPQENRCEAEIDHLYYEKWKATQALQRKMDRSVVLASETGAL